MGKKLTQNEVQQTITDNFQQPIVLVSEYTGNRKDITLQCQVCGHTWTTKAANVLYMNKHKQVSHHCPNCYKQQSQIGEMKECAYCGVTFYRSPYQIQKNQSGLFYCCREHGNRHKNQLRKQQGEWNNSLNYRLKAFSTYEHKCHCCGWNEDDRILEVHHIDEDRTNNTIDNLMILCPTCHRKITLGYYGLSQGKLVPLK